MLTARPPRPNRSAAAPASASRLQVAPPDPDKSRSSCFPRDLLAAGSHCSPYMSLAVLPPDTGRTVKRRPLVAELKEAGADSPKRIACECVRSKLCVFMSKG